MPKIIMHLDEDLNYPRWVHGVSFFQKNNNSGLIQNLSYLFMILFLFFRNDFSCDP